jgi:putative tryptophan/tyrosine transport system substrate-binding protein
MTRREFVELLSGTVAAWPFVAHAQQGAPRHIGVLGADAIVWNSWTVAFVARLRELGWIEGDTIDIDYRWAGGSSKRVSDFTAELLRRHVEVIVTYGSAVAVLEQVTTTIPIVLAVASDPVSAGLVTSLAQPAGNVTGISIQQPQLIGKRLELLREVIPQLRRLAIMANAGYAAPALEAEKAKTTAQTLGLEAARLEIWRSEDIAPAFEAIRGKADALYVVSDALIAANRTLITTLALSARLTILNYGDYVAAGGLMSYGPNFANLFRQAADMVDKILRGTKPGDIPVEQPSKFELVINLETAKALGITVPESLLANADKVIS